MKFERTKNTIKNSLFAIIEKILVLFLPFVVRTVIIYKLGVEYTGLNSLFTTILRIVNLADIGFGSAVQFFLYKPVADDDYSTINALFNFLRKTYYFISVLVLVIGLSFLPFLNTFIKDNTCPNDLNIYALYLIYVFNSAFTYCFGADFLIIIGVYQRDRIKHLVGSFGEIIKCLSQVVILIVTKNYYLYAFLIPLTTLSCNISYYFIARKIFPTIKAEGKLDKEQFKVVRKKLVALFFHHLASVLTNTIDTIVISTVFGLTVLGNYGNYAVICEGVTGFVFILINFINK